MVNASLESTAEGTSEASVRHARSYSARALLAFVRGVGMIPFSIRSTVGASIGYIVGLLPLRETRIATLQLQAFMPDQNTSSVVPKIFAHVGRSILESFNLAPLTSPPFKHISCEDWSDVERWNKEDRPIVALTAHTGNWDLLAAYVIARGLKVSTIGREARNPDLQVALRAMRDAYGIETIWRSDKSGVKRIVGCFKERRIIAALIDQDTRVDSCFVPFFGTPAKTPSALIELGKRYNARFVTAFIVRTHGTHFEIKVRELDSSLTTEALLTEYNRRLEEILRLHPDQWVWFHKRWRSHPTKGTLSSKEYLAWLSDKISSSRH